MDYFISHQWEFRRSYNFGAWFGEAKRSYLCCQSYIRPC